MSSNEATPQLTSASTESFSTSPEEGQSINYQSADDGSEKVLPNPGPARPLYYLARGNGRFTPLIALDELPSNVKIGDLPLTLTAHEVGFLGGRFCTPAVEVSKEKYVIRGDLDTSTGHNDNLLEINEDPASSSRLAKTADVPSSGAINARLARALEGVGPTTDPEDLKKALLQLKTQKNFASGQRYNPTTPGVLGQKVYCTHWMRTGECDFTQQGCMFLHAMPDLDTLELLGFRSYPRWFREMPRQYQIQNAKDFDEVGLDHHRHARGASGSANWHNQPNKYMPQQGLAAQSFPQYSQPWPNMMPGQLNATSYGAMDGPWRNAAFDQSAMATLPHRPAPHGLLPFDRPFTPFDASNLQASQSNFPAPEPLRHSIWSRSNSPDMGIINRLHKPLSPQVVSVQPRFRNRNNASPFNKSTRSPSMNAGYNDGSTTGHKHQLSDVSFPGPSAGSKPGSLFKVNPQVRERELQRSVPSVSPETSTVSDNNSIRAHSTGQDQAMPAFSSQSSTKPIFATGQSPTARTDPEKEAETKIIDA